nr:T9SS type A sorting domain-containing protein [uncultured Carboxylicivirga sp.]
MKCTLKCSVMFAMFLIGSNLWSQSISIKHSDGSSTEFEINNLKSIVFTNNNLLFNKTEGASNYYSIFYTQQLFFDASTAVDKNLSLTDAISVYPNPASSSINVQMNEVTEGKISVYSITGELIKRNDIEGLNTAIDISSLTNGIYLLQVNNQTIKFIKQ